MIERLAILGSGAMACLFGARLAGHVDLTLLGSWPAGVAALRRHGIQLESENGTETYPVEVVTDLEELRGTRFAMVLVKSWQTERAASQLSQFLADDGVALTLQNGLGNLEALSAALGGGRALLGVTTYGANMVGPGKVRSGGEGVIQLGAHPQAEAWRALFQSAGLETQIVADLGALVWGKLAVNAGINPLTALLGVPNGALLELPGAGEVMAGAVEEVQRVAEAAGVPWHRSDPVGYAEEVARKTASNRSSMLQDLDRGAPTEIDAICGAVVVEGRKRGVETPVNRTLWHLVRAAAAGGPDS